MQHLKYILTTIFFIALSAAALAQVRFDNLRHEFGTILWHDVRTATFTLTNTDSVSLWIKDVRPDCGCTAVEWTQGIIAPGKSGQLTATFDAELLGHFEKQVAVYTNLAEKPYYLTLSGDVVTELIDEAEDYPYHVGDIYIESDNLEFDDVRRGDMPVKSLKVFNAGRQSLEPELMHLPKYLTVTADPQIIRPGRAGRLNFTLNSELLRAYGLTQTSIYVSRFAGDRVSRDNEINVSATLLPEQTYTDAQMAIAPRAELDSTTINMGSMGTKKRLKHDVILTNTGDSPLVISALQVYNPGLSVKLGKRTLAPGESDKLRITVNATTADFKGRRRVLLITNDPVNPKIVVDVVVKK